MATKKQEIMPEEELQISESEEIPQTGEQPGEEASRMEMQDAAGGENSLLQTETELSESPPPSELKLDEKTDTSENSPDSDVLAESVLQTDSESMKKPRRRKKTGENQNQSDTEGNADEKGSDDGVTRASEPKRKRAGTRSSISVLSIDDRPTVETDADKAKNDLLDLLESQKTGRILTGTIQGVERPADNPNRSLAVIYHGEFKVIIPAEEAVEPPADYRGRLPEDVLHYMLTKRLGAEVDYIVKGVDPESGLAAASRLDAMRARRKEYYLGTDRDGNNLLYSGVCAEARIVSVIRAGIFIDLFGLEIYIPLRELSYQRWMDAAAHFQPGQRILVKVMEVDRSDRNQIKAKASVKQAGENPYEKALRRYSVGNRYVGTVSMVDTNGVFVALDGGIDCLCSYPKRGRPPRGSRVTVRILGINHDSNRIWGAITHIAAPR